MIKIIFFDIDGTLLPLKTTKLSTNLINALNAVQEKGVKLFLASGRPKFVLPEFEGVHFDGALCFNGQYGFDQNGVLYENAMDPQDVMQITKNVWKNNHHLVASRFDEMKCDEHEDRLDEYFRIASQSIEKTDDFIEYITKYPIYQMMIATPKELDPEVLEGTKEAKIVRWWPHACDVIPKNGGKGKAVDGVLKAYGFSKDEAMAFGDGGNDIDMLEAVGISVAMDNAVPELKEIADYITKSVEDDGVVHALKHYGLL